MIALEALNMVEGFAIDKLEHNSEEYLHLLIEATKLAFADGLYYVSDPDFHSIPLEHLLSKGYAEKRRRLIQSQALEAPAHGEHSEFGGGQVIVMDPHTDTLIAGSDPRKDGCAQGY